MRPCRREALDVIAQAHEKDDKKRRGPLPDEERADEADRYQSVRRHAPFQCRPRDAAKHWVARRMR